MKFVGIDIAWSERNPSGAAVIDAEGNLIRASGDLRTNEELCEYAELREGEDAVITIDAPLIVKNPQRQRPVERELTEIFGPYDAGPYPANLSNPAFKGTGRIQRFIKLLESLGFSQRPKVLKQQPQRTFLFFPAPAQVVLFPCLTHNGHTHCRPLRYKHKPGRSWVEVQCECDMYRARLRSLQIREPQLKYSAEVRKAIGVDIADFTGTRYKALDDLLDGIFCAYLAYYFWHGGEEGCWVVGDTESGYVTLPLCKLSHCPLVARVDR